MSLIQFESHYYYFAAGTFLILFFVVRFAENFHHGHPTPGSFYSTRDEPIANRFIFAYGLVSIPYVFLLMIAFVVSAFLFIYGIQVIILAIIIFFNGNTFSIYIIEIENIIEYIVPWQLYGFSGYEIFGFALAGYRIGYYSEEKKRKAYFNSILVYFVYFSIFVWGIVGLENNPSQSVFYSEKYQSEEIILFLVLDLIAILLMTWFGNSRSIALEEGDDVSILPSVKGYMRNVYILTLLATLIFFIFSTNLKGILQVFGVQELKITMEIDEYIMFSCFFATIIVIFLYAIISIIKGDISRIVITVDENDNVVSDDENQVFKNPKYLSIFVIVMGIISFAGLYFLPLP